MCVCLCVCVCAYVSVCMIEICKKLDKSNTYNWFRRCDISFFYFIFNNFHKLNRFPRKNPQNKVVQSGFSQATLIKHVHCKKSRSLIKICSHFQNKPYKTTPRILSDFTIPGEHHTTRKQYQNRTHKKLEQFLHSVPYFKGLFSFSLSPPPPPLFRSLSTRHHIIVNVFDETGYTETPFLPLFPYFFSVSSLKLFPLSFDQKSLLKPDTFDSKPSFSVNTFTLSVILSYSPFVNI